MCDVYFCKTCTSVNLDVGIDLGEQTPIHLVSFRQQVHMQPLGQAQVWQGETEAVLWEAFLLEPARQHIDWPETLDQFWQAVERDMGVSRILTQPHEQTMPERYPEFLSRLGYGPHPEYERWWYKHQRARLASRLVISDMLYSNNESRRSTRLSNAD